MGFKCYGHLAAGSPLYQNRLLVEKRLIHQGELVGTEHLLGLIGEKVDAYASIYGGRQAGKTSLLLHLKKQITQNGIGTPCWIDFQHRLGASPEHTFLFIAQRIIDQVPELAGVKLPEKFIYGGFEFDRWLANLPIQKPLVILMDELGALPLETRQTLGGMLRGIFTEREDTRLEKVMVFFFGGIELNEMTAVEVSPLSNICREFLLLDLDQEATKNVLQVGFTEEDSPPVVVEFDALAKLIYSQVSGQPYLTQRFGEALKSQKKEISNDSLNDLVVSARNLLISDPYLDRTYRMIIKYQLKESCESLYNLPEYSSLRDDWSKLLLLSVAKVKNGCISISNPLLERDIRERLRYVTGTAVKPGSAETKIYNIYTGGGSYIGGNLSTGGGNFVGRDETKQLEYEAFEAYQRRRNEVLDVVIEAPCLYDERRREDTLFRASLHAFRPKLDLSGPSVDAVPRIFMFLEQQKRPDTGPHVLGLFLNQVKTRAKQNHAKKIQAFIDQYGLI